MYSVFYELDTAVKAKVAAGNHSDALDNVKEFITSVMNEQSTPGEVVGARKVDVLCEIIGDDYFGRFFEETLREKTFTPIDKHIVIVCTGLYKYGGTTLVISDLVNAHPGCRCTVIATNYLNDMTAEDLELSRIDGCGANVLIAPAGNAEQKLRWLIQQFLDIAPSRIFLLNHHQDSVIVSAARPFVERTNVIFYHHADYNICLGVHMKGAIHVDPHNVGFYNCRTKEGLRDNVYVPLTVDDGGVNRVEATFIGSGELTTCSSGTYHKFRNFYLYPYSDLLVDRLKVRNGRHVHVGGISPPELTAIRQKLTDNDVDAERFVHIPWTPSLWRTLVDQKIDLFIGSFPIGGARTTIEVMGAGIPILMPDNYLSRFFSSRDIVYSDAFLWKYPADFAEVLRTVSAKSLSMHAKRSRAHYILQYCSASIDIEGKFNAICAGRPTPEPYALYPYQPDPLDKALHFSHIASLTAHHAAQHAIASLPVSPEVVEEQAGNSLTRIFTDLREGREKRRRLLRTMKRLSPEDRLMYKTLAQGSTGIQFDGETYLARNPDVAEEGADPLLHFVMYGRHEGREPVFFIK